MTAPPLSDYAQRKKIDYFLRPIPRSAAILEVGSGSGWVGRFLRENGWTNYRGIDFAPPADIVGDIRRWKELGLAPESFDVIVAFEVVEHVACFDACFELLKPGGSLLLTSPVPRMDWACRMLEAVGLNQKRTSPHDNLIDFRNVPRFRPVEIRVIAGMFQWGKFMRPGP